MELVKFKSGKYGIRKEKKDGRYEFYDFNIAHFSEKSIECEYDSRDAVKHVLGKLIAEDKMKHDYGELN